VLHAIYLSIKLCEIPILAIGLPRVLTIARVALKIGPGGLLSVDVFQFFTRRRGEEMRIMKAQS
jgi:hypothetical protein